MRVQHQALHAGRQLQLRKCVRVGRVQGAVADVVDQLFQIEWVALGLLRQTLHQPVGDGRRPGRPVSSREAASGHVRQFTGAKGASVDFAVIGQGADPLLLQALQFDGAKGQQDQDGQVGDGRGR